MRIVSNNPHSVSVCRHRHTIFYLAYLQFSLKIMSTITNSTDWQKLILHAKKMRATLIKDLFINNPHRFQDFSVQAAGLLLDYSKHLVNRQTIDLLVNLAKSVNLNQKIKGLVEGEKINTTENRPALHTALRNYSQSNLIIDGKNIMPAIRLALQRMETICQELEDGHWRGASGELITDIVNIGIGGSDLGVHMAYHALQPYACSRIRCHFVANIDSADMLTTLHSLKPATTLFIIASKSFSTPETLANALLAKQWLSELVNGSAAVRQHFIAITQDTQKALDWGITSAHILPLWDWVGGRYSIWSSIGLALAISIGMKNFYEFLAGALAMDQHFIETDFLHNMPVILALLSVWYINFFSAQSHAILPYDYRLRELPSYLQQLEMESNGKRIRQDGSLVDYATAPVMWGMQGTNGQHAFYQLLHQGTFLIPCDFIVAASNPYDRNGQHAMLYANCLSQSRVLMQGKNHEEVMAEDNGGQCTEIVKKLLIHKVLPGNQPSSTIVLPELSPRYLGTLLALYEHKTFVQGVIWGINSFDQWGVEYGKQIANHILADLHTSERLSTYDSSTEGLINYFKGRALTQHR